MTRLEPFQIAVPDAGLVDLRQRLATARWPSRQTVTDWSQGLPLEVLRQLYWESIVEVTIWFTTPGGASIAVPTGCTVFPKEVPHPYRRWAEPRFPSIVHWGEPQRGGHFGAWEQPALFISEVRAVARALVGS